MPRGKAYLKQRSKFIGRRFGRLVVLKFHDVYNTNSRWLCKCECGAKVVVLRNNLVRGNAKSCGCLRAERIKTHEMSGSPEYKAWSSMIERCNNKNPDSMSFKNYVSRGITVCKRWRKFENFLKDMGKRPSPDHSVGRLNNDDGYKPSNCHWETTEEQNRNKRTNVFLTAFGKTQCLKDWAREIGVSYPTIQHRIKKLGWSVKKALSSGAYEHGHRNDALRIEFNGESLTVRQWIKRTGISRSTIHNRIAAGRPPEEILSTANFRNSRKGE